MVTMGQALDAAIKRHTEDYPGSEVYHAEVKEAGPMKECYRVELRASHFSVPMVYYGQCGVPFTHQYTVWSGPL